MERHEILDQAMDRIIGTYFGLERGFTKGFPHHPFKGDVGERWVPQPNVLETTWSTGEMKIAAVLLDLLHREYGIDQFLVYPDEDAFVEGKYIYPSEKLWPGVRVVTSEFTHLDRGVFIELCKLIKP